MIFHKKIVSILIVFLITLFNQAFAKKDTLTVGYYESPPFVAKEADGTLSGVSIWAWEEINRHNDSIHYKYVDFSESKSPLLELLDQLKNKTIDVSLTPLTIMPERNSFINFSQPFYVSNLTVAVPRVSGFEKTKAFLSNFMSKSFLFTVLLLFLVLLLFGFLVWLFERRNKESDFDNNYKGVFHGIWWSAVTMTTVGYGDKTPKTLGGRLIGLVWMFTAIILVSGFTASITTSLTISSLDGNSNSLENFKDKRVGTVKGSATDRFLTKHLFTRKKTALELTEGLRLLQKKEIDAFVYDESFIKYHIEKTPHFSDLKVTDLRFNIDLYAFAFSKNVNKDFVSAFSRQIIAMRKSTGWEYFLRDFGLSEI